MKNDEIPAKPYDAIEDAIDMSKKDPNRSWDDLLRKSPTTEKPVVDKSDETSESGRVAASVETHRLYRIR